MSIRRFIWAMLVLVSTATCWAQTPAQPVFTYQGQLKQDGVPAEGAYDMAFSLFDAPAGGTQIGNPCVIPAIPVTQGLFTAVLNGGVEFGQNAFNGEARWIEVTVAGQPLAPRQWITPAPYSIFSLAPWQLNGSAISYTLGSVGIGTTSPSSMLDVAGKVTMHSLTVNGKAQVDGLSMATGASNGYVLTSDTNGVASWQPGGLVLPFDASANLPTGVVFGIKNTATSGSNAVGIHGECASTDGIGVGGLATAATGRNYGVWGESQSIGGYGVVGNTSSTGASAAGVRGIASATTGAAIAGYFTSAGGGSAVYATANSGVAGTFRSSTGNGLDVLTSGVYGAYIQAQDTGVFAQGATFGLYGQANSRGVYGNAGTGPDARGVYGTSNSTTGTGVYGWAQAGSGATAGVYGKTNSASGFGVYSDGPLFVNGLATVSSFKLSNNAGVGKVLTSDANGVGTWQSAPTLGLPFNGTANVPSSAAFRVTNTGSGAASGVEGIVQGTTGFNYGVLGGTGSHEGVGVYGIGGKGIYGLALGPGDDAGYFEGPVVCTDVIESHGVVSNGPIESQSGGFKFPDGTVQTSIGWLPTGNSGTDPSVNFIGTSDDNALTVKVNNQVAMRYVPVASSDDAPNIFGGSPGKGSNGNVVVGATIAGGGHLRFDPNYVIGDYGTVSGGAHNLAGKSAVVTGGYRNSASGPESAVCGGSNNRASGWSAAVIGASDSTASGDWSLVLSGDENVASGDYAIAAGESLVVASGEGSFAWGVYSEAHGELSCAMGDCAIANHDRSFVWSSGKDPWGDPQCVGTTAEGQFLIFAHGGVGINTEPFGFHLAVNGEAAKPDGGSWSSLSDARLKHDIAPLPPGSLDKLLALHGRTFEFNEEAIDSKLATPGRKVGLIAQEVEEVFPEWVKEDTEGYKYITEHGTTALFVEALRELRAEKDEQIQTLQTELEQQVCALKVQLEAQGAQRDRQLAECIARIQEQDAQIKGLLSTIRSPARPKKKEHNR